MATKKIKINFLNQEFLLPANALQTDSYNKTPYIYMGAKHTASVIKQYVTKNYPSIKVWATSDVYSGGSSTRVNVSNTDGSSVDSNIYEDIRAFGNSLKGGSFDGMYDIYNSREDDVTTKSGTPMKYFPSYVFIDNSPKWGSVEYWMNQYNVYLENINNVDYAKMVSAIEKAGSFLEYNKEYMTKTEYKRCSLVLK
jgi:hypothetical protein